MLLLLYVKCHDLCNYGTLQAHPTVEYIINIRIGTEYFISVKKKLTSFKSIDQYTASWKWHFDLTDSFKSHQNYTFNVSLIVKYGSHLYLIMSNEFWCITLEMFYEKVHANKNWLSHTEASQERNQFFKELIKHSLPFQLRNYW